MNRFWIAVAVLLIVNLTISDSVNADGALKGFKIVEGKHSKRRLGHPRAIEHSWVVPFKNQDYTFLISIDTQLYNKARNEERLRRGDFEYFPSMVEEGTEALQDLNREFKRVTSALDKESQVNFVLAFVLSITYIKDERTGFDEYYKSAIETLGDEGGDCEDSSILFASILSGLGFELALIVFPGSRFAQGHVGVGVKGDFQGDYCRDGNNEYYYCETTSPGWKLGVFPPGYEYRRREIMPIHPNPNPPKPVIPQVKRPKPTPPKRLSPQQTLEKGIKLYEQARFNEAIKSLQSVLNRDGINLEQQALAHLYWGCSELGRTNRENRDYRNYVLKAKKQFEEAFRHNPDRILPPRIGEDHPVFGPLFEEVRKESIGKLTVTASPPQTGIWIDGNGINRKIGTGTVSIKLFKGNYTVKGIYKGESIEEIVTIEPNRHKSCVLEILVVDKTSPTISLRKPHTGATFKVKQDITIEAEVTDDTSVKEVLVHFSPTDKRILSKKGYSDRYTIGIRGGNAGFIRYYLTATDEAGNKSRYPKTGELKITVVEPLDTTPPIISLIKLGRVDICGIICICLHSPYLIHNGQK